MTEFEAKQSRIHALLDEHHLDGLLLQRVSSFAWATCGAASYVNTAVTFGASSLLITRDARYLIANNIEVARLEQETSLEEQGWDFRVAPWHAPNAMAELTRGLKLGADLALPNALDLTAKIARCRANLTPEEGVRLHALGKTCADAMRGAIRAVEPGMTEYEIAARLALETQARGAQPIVNLVATDERVWKFRHPLPTEKELERYAMLVLSARKAGVVCSITRLVHFGKLPDELRHKADACASVDATMIAATRPGKTLGEILQTAVNAYAVSGFPSEWQLHHQGGASGYEPREYLATPGSKDVVLSGQGFAWNPSIAGVKSEDTILVGSEANEIITKISDWPSIKPPGASQSLFRPRILEVT